VEEASVSRVMSATEKVWSMSVAADRASFSASKTASMGSNQESSALGNFSPKGHP
jgi:hypothetical protein